MNVRIVFIVITVFGGGKRIAMSLSYAENDTLPARQPVTADENDLFVRLFLYLRQKTDRGTYTRNTVRSRRLEVRGGEKNRITERLADTPEIFFSRTV